MVNCIKLCKKHVFYKFLVKFICDKYKPKVNKIEWIYLVIKYSVKVFTIIENMEYER